MLTLPVTPAEEKEEMSKFWDAMQTLGLSEEVPDDAAKTAPKAAPRASAPPVAATPPGAKGAAADPAVVAGFDESARKALVSAMANANAPLVEEFDEMLGTLQSGVTDEAQMYKMALKLLARRGGVAAVEADYNKCLTALQAQNEHFAAGLAAESEKRVGGKTRQMDADQAELTKIQVEIDRLGESAQKLKESLDELGADVIEEQKKMHLAGERFALAYSALRTEMESRLQKLLAYTTEKK